VNTTVDPVAYRDLKTLLELARANKVQVFAYFHPYSSWRWEKLARSGEWQRYQSRIAELFDLRREVVLDLTSAPYDALRSDVACYTDEHLSAAGARLVLGEIQRMLDDYYGRDRGKLEPTALESGSTWPCLGRPGAGSGFDRG
jgi:hypothetical protein